MNAKLEQSFFKRRPMRTSRVIRESVRVRCGTDKQARSTTSFKPKAGFRVATSFRVILDDQFTYSHVS
jgi:hypothetical protein